VFLGFLLFFQGLRAAFYVNQKLAEPIMELLLSQVWWIVVNQRMGIKISFVVVVFCLFFLLQCYLLVAVQFERYYDSSGSATPPVRLDKCMDMGSSEVTLLEPLVSSALTKH